MRGQDGLSSKENRTALLAFFGQVVTNEIVMASESGCPIEMHRIEIEKCDEMYDKDCRGDRYIPFHRALYDRNTGQSPNAPREQVGFVIYLNNFRKR
jgi:dual oxidase